MTLVQYPTRFRSNLVPVFNQFFNDFLSGDDFLSRNRGLVPAANIRETQEAFLIELAVPGLKKEDFQIQVEENLLRISANVQAESEEQDAATKIHRREFSFHSFERSFRLPKSADSDKITASYTDGVLQLNIPKREEAKPKTPRTIEIA
ncbi:Hsp20/alpha crystallin family protein [Rhodoflexus sp.]